MNVTIEQGNTATKIAFFEDGQPEAFYTYNTLTVSVCVSLFEKHRPIYGIMSTVTEKSPEILSFLCEYLNLFIFLNEHTLLPVEIRYETPETLGKDRLAAVVGANFLQPGKDLLVIDAGTAITYEMIEAPNIYLGGNISPGMETRFKALNQFTNRLPLIKETDDVPRIGTSTETAIRAGVVNGICYEMDGYIDELHLKYPNLLVFLTGGHSNYFAGRLKNLIFANINLVLIGLNRILEYNVENKESSSSRPSCRLTDGNACAEQH